MESNGSLAEEREKLKDISRTPSPSPAAKKRNTKATKILDACKSRDIQTLRILATSEGGLVSDDIRCQAWPLLLGCTNHDDNIKQEDVSSDSWKQLPEHKEENQVRLDVDRSFIYYPNDQSSRDLDRLKEELSDLITEVLRRQPYLCYFQGYHEICQVFLLVLEPRSRAAAVARLSTLRIRDFMLPTLAQSLYQLQLIPEIISAVNWKLREHLSGTQPFFALAEVLTMYAHDIEELGQIARLFDVLLAREAVFSVYMFAQIVLQRSDELFETPADETDMLHFILSKLPRPLDIETLIANTVELFEKYPPEKLKSWRLISNNSVLKTARWQDQALNQTLEDGKLYFKKQVKELEWAERRKMVLQTAWKYRRPAGAVGVAFLVGLLSYMLRGTSGPSGYFGVLWRQYWGYKGH